MRIWKTVPLLLILAIAGACSSTPDAENKDEGTAAAKDEKKAAEESKPAPPPKIKVPAGTTLTVVLSTSLDSGKNNAGDTFTGNLSEDVIVDGKTALARGTAVQGKVVSAEGAGKVKGVGKMSLTLTEATVHGKSVPLETTYGYVPNMILSLAARPNDGSGSQRKYVDGMPFGTRGGMSVEHNFPADGEYVLTIGDMVLGRTVPNMEFENTVIALLDGKEFWRTQLGGEEEHRSVDQKLDDSIAKINSRLKDIRFNATAGQHTVAVTFLRRSYAEDDGRTMQYQAGDDRRGANPIEGGQHRVQAVHAFHIKGPVKITGMSDSPTRQKVFICKPASPADEKPCALANRSCR